MPTILVPSDSQEPIKVKNTRKRRIIYIVIGAILGAIVLFCAFGALVICWFMYAFSQATSQNTNLDDYPKLLEELQSTGLVAHFPPTIPANSSAARLSAVSGFMSQGGGHLQIRYQLPASEIERLYEDAQKRAKDFYDGGHVFTAVNAPDKTDVTRKRLAGTYFATTDNGDTSFPDDYRIFVFDAKSSGDNVWWNRFTSYGVVISKQRNEIIYYAMTK
jgi:hypothetical protein